MPRSYRSFSICLMILLNELYHIKTLSSTIFAFLFPVTFIPFCCAFFMHS